MRRERYLTLALAVALATLLSCGGEPSSPEPGPSSLRIVAPSAGDTLSGVAGLELSLQPPVPVLGMSVRWDAEEWLPIQRPQAYLSIPTLGSGNGEHRITVAVDTEAGEHLEAEVDVRIDNPPHRLLTLDGQQVPVSNGQTLSLELEYSAPGLSLAADLSALDSRFSSDAVRFEELGAGRYRLTYLVSRDNQATEGGHRVAIAATDADGRTNVDYLPLELRKLPRLPFTVREGTFIDAPVPALEDTTDKATGIDPAAPPPSITSVQGASVLPTGAELPIDVTWTQSPDNPVDRLLVSADGFSGFFVVPAQAASATITVGLPALVQGQPDVPLSLSVAAVGANGSSSSWVSRSILPLPLPVSGVMVTLFWDSAADMDLTMRTPLGGAIHFDNRSADGGNLNLDANSDCEGSLVSTENISWAPAAVLQGPYQVYVNQHDACAAATTNWTVIAQFCGRVEVRSGTVSGGSALPGADGPLTLAFDVDCTQRITGRLEYQSIAGTTTLFRPAPFVPVRAVAVSGGAALGTTFSDAAGNYALVFANPQQRPVAIEVETSWVDPYTGEVRVEVTPERSNTVHKLRAPDTVAASEVNRVLNWRVDAAQGAGALSVLNTLRRSYSWAMAHLPSGLALGGLRARWDARPSADFFSHYQHDVNEVWISSKPEALDDFDASVIAHEFMHFVIGTLSFEGVGGGHMYKADPELALSEGAATALGQASLGSSEYINLGRFWSFEELEFPFSLRAAFPPNLRLPPGFGTPEPVLQERFGTSDGSVNGQVSEWLVAMIFWDLMDGVDRAAEPHDLLADRTLGLTYSLLSHMSGSQPPDRGATGRDLVDALDGFQQYYGPAVQTAVQRLTAERGFPYVAP